MSRPGPAPGLLGRPAPRAARVLRAPTRRVSPRRNCSDVKSRVSCTSATQEGRACRGRALRRRRPTPHPRPNPQPPTHGPAREVPEPPSARGVRTGLPRWLALTYEDSDIGRGARPARPPAPHAHARLGCRTPRAGDGPPGTSAPTIVPPAPTWPLPFSHPHPLGPYHSPARTHLVPTILPPAPTSAPTIVPPAPAWPLPFSHPHPLGPYHCPTRTHLIPTILPPAPTWPLPFSRPHPLGLYHSPARTHLAPTVLPPAPTWSLPFSRPHPLGPYLSPARTHIGPYHCLTRTHSVPTLALQRPGARSPRAALGAGRPLSPTPCVHPMRVPCAAKLSPKKTDFFVIEGCRRHTFMCRASRRYAPRPIKLGESGVSGGVCAACIFFRGPLARTAAVWYTHGVFDHGRGFGWDVRPWVNAGRFKERSAEVEEGTTS